MGLRKGDKDSESEAEVEEKHVNSNKDHIGSAPLPGPMEKRGCTDIIFLLLFIAFWVGMFIVASKAVAMGQPYRLTHGVDSDGNVCGLDNTGINSTLRGRAQDFVHKPYLYFLPNLSISNHVTFWEVCVPACPSENHLIPDSTDEIICPYRTEYSLSNLAPNGTCWGTFSTRSVLHRCAPFINANYTAVVQDVTAALNLQRAADLSLRLIGDLIQQWRYYCYAATTALVLSFLWLALMRKLAGVIVWGTILAAIGCLTLLAVFFYKQALVVQNNYNSLPIYARLISQEDQIKFLKGVFIFLCIVDGLCVLITIFMVRRIRIAIGLFKESAKAMMKMPAILLVPVIIAFAIVPLAVYWIWIGAYLATAGSPTFDEGGSFAGYKANSQVRQLQLYHLFGGFWTLNFLHAIGECTIAGAIGSYYWIHDKSQLTHVPVLAAFKRTFRYHLGSLAFGSLILAAVQFIRFLFHRLEEQVKIKQGRIARCAMKVIDCLLACFERFIKFLDENAYIMVAIYGYSFCAGARRALSLLIRNFLRVGALNCISSFIIFLGKVFVTALNVIIYFFVLRNDTDVSNFVIPLIAIAIVTYAISAAFFGIVKMAIKTMLLSFCEDCERHDGSAEKPYFMSDHLKAIVDTENHLCCC